VHRRQMDILIVEKDLHAKRENDWDWWGSGFPLVPLEIVSPVTLRKKLLKLSNIYEVYYIVQWKNNSDRDRHLSFDYIFYGLVIMMMLCSHNTK
jgi:hypothetical protein